MPLRGGHAHAPSAEVLGEYNHLTPIPRKNLDDKPPFIDLPPVCSMRSMDVSGIHCVHAVADHMVSWIGADLSSL